jgi:hypothetical protein
MKVFECPLECAFAEPDYRNYDTRNEEAREKQHRARLKQFLIDSGYTGPYTGRVAYFGVADGNAAYMLADGRGKFGSSFLIHLPYGDAYHCQGIQHFPKKAIIKLFGQQ